MPKRFFDSRLLEKEWWQVAPPAYKVLFKCMVLGADHAGIWRPNWREMTFRIGETVTADGARLHLAGQIYEIDPDKWLLVKFMVWQYGAKWRTDSRHIVAGARAILDAEGVFDIPEPDSKLRLRVGYPYITDIYPAYKGSLQDKDKEKDKDLGTTKGDSQGGESRPDPKQAPEVESVLNLWAELFGSDPTRTDARIWVARRLGLVRQSKGHEVTPYQLADLERAVRNYRVYLTAQGHDKAYAVRNFFNAQHAYCDAFTAADWQPPRPSGGGIKGAAPRIERNLPDDQLNF